MKNFEIYSLDPTSRKLENQGVADVNSRSENILRYELDTFVCDGQYAEGMKDVLRTFLDNVAKPEQPAVWVSGFYGSGKSHLVKMMAALWTDHAFADKAHARDIADLPDDIRQLYRELSVQGRRLGGLHSAIGTLSAGASDSVRMLILSIVFKSVGLPANYAQAKLILWLRRQGVEDVVKAKVEELGGDWREEIGDMYVADTLHEALVAARPETFASLQSCADALGNMFPNKNDVSNEEMASAIGEALSRDGKLPLTLLVLDEMQQFIGNNTDRALLVQEAVQTCSKAMDGRLLVVATGQTAVTGTACLSKIEGRFTVRIELSDTDIDAVIRKVVLAKRPEAAKAVHDILQDNIGEISRHLAGSQLSYAAGDEKYLVADYPVLPTRRRFWERTLQALDRTGTDSQLRNQLAMNLKMIQGNADRPLGHVSPGDFLFFDLADKLLQSRILPRPTYETIIPWYRNGTADEKLTARACGLIFLIGKLVAGNKDIGLAATVDVIADLMVEDLRAGSAELRAKLPALLDNCKALMKIGDEYRIQTPESLEWKNDFLSRQNALRQNNASTETERDTRLKQLFTATVSMKPIKHGKSQIPRNILLDFNKPTPSPESKHTVTLWLRDGWHIDENSVRADARQGGLESHIIYGFIPKFNSDELHQRIIDYMAASSTLAAKGTPSTPEGIEAQAAMVSTQTQANAQIAVLLKELLGRIVVYQGGGNEIQAAGIQEKLSEAEKVAVSRLYPQFDESDDIRWAKVYDKARMGMPDALTQLQYNGEAKEHPICKQLFAFIGAGKTGREIAEHFGAAPFGWGSDVLDGALQVLLANGIALAIAPNGTVIDHTRLERKAIGATRFKLEGIVITASQKIALRRLFLKADIQATNDDLPAKAQDFLARLEELALSAGGTAPRPALPDMALLNSLKCSSGNELLKKIFEQQSELETKISEWKGLKDAIERRIGTWNDLERLAGHAATLPEAEPLFAQMNAIREQRLLLAEPDMVAPVQKGLADICRRQLDTLKASYDDAFREGEEQLAGDGSWQKLPPDVQSGIRTATGLRRQDTDIEIKASSVADIVNTLATMSFQAFGDKVAALPGRYAQALQQAAKELEPAIQYNPQLPARMLKTVEDVDEWLKEAGECLRRMLKNGPIQM